MAREKTALLFPGQGSQYVGMARDFYTESRVAQAIFDTITCDFDAKKLCFDGPAERLNDTRYCQVCIFLASLAIAETVRQQGVAIDAVAGISLGEYSALCYAGAFSVQDGVDILTERGRVMADNIPKDSGMKVVIGLEPAVLQDCCLQATSPNNPCEIASYITPTRMVITGTNQAIEIAEKICIDRGARRVLPIKASAAFHSQLAQPAAVEFAKELQQYHISQPLIPVYYNFDGTTQCNDIAAMEARQLYTSLQFVETVKNMYRDGVKHFLAVGPGATIAGAVREVAKAASLDVVTVRTIDKYTDINQGP